MAGPQKIPPSRNQHPQEADAPLPCCISFQDEYRTDPMRHYASHKTTGDDTGIMGGSPGLGRPTQPTGPCGQVASRRLRQVSQPPRIGPSMASGIPQIEPPRQRGEGDSLVKLDPQGHGRDNTRNGQLNGAQVKHRKTRCFCCATTESPSR